MITKPRLLNWGWSRSRLILSKDRGANPRLQFYPSDTIAWKLLRPCFYGKDWTRDMNYFDCTKVNSGLGRWVSYRNVVFKHNPSQDKVQVFEKLQYPSMLCQRIRSSLELRPNNYQPMLNNHLKLLSEDQVVSWQNRRMSTFKKFNLSENIWTIPNLLCVLRMGMAPVLGYLVVNSQFPFAIGLLVIAGLTDLLDGWIARVVPGQSSVIGSFLDPMADKVLVGTLFLSLTYMNLIPVPLTALVLGRDIFLIAAGFYIRYQSLLPPKTFSRYFDITSPSAQLAPTLISKVNTGVQLSLIGITLLSTVVPAIEHAHLVFVWYCTGGSTVLSALSYVFVKDTYKVITKVPSKTVEKQNAKGERNS